MIRTVIVDDEFMSRETLRDMISLYCVDIEIVGEAQDVRSGVKIIKQLKPDLVFLDIRMPDGSGFELVRQLMPVSFKVIFITAYEEYAIKAFKFNAIDYITKPVDPEELRAAVEKAGREIEITNLNDNLRSMLDAYMKPQETEAKKFILRTFDAFHILDYDDIIRCESDRNYSIFILKSGERIMISKSLSEFAEQLEENGFFRVHQSHFINLKYLKKFKKDEFIAVLKDDTEITVAYRKRDELIRVIRDM
ncbi:MAG: LytTR family DNA-binding domain-containing protein [Lentimicrobium sp.]|jgi:two-component system LytT family response regulator|nr:LytTR family DNA-binding domain-containing protein [Lentimicrobium sp.]